jgi:drug/metabolite transporter (DMT)-like permease
LTAAAQKNHLTSGLLLAAVGSIAFSGKAIIVKLAYRHGIDAVTLLMLRMLFAFPLFLAMALWAGRGQAAMTRQDWFGIVGLGSGLIFCSAVTYACDLTYSGQLVQRLGPFVW